MAGSVLLRLLPTLVLVVVAALAVPHAAQLWLASAPASPSERERAVGPTPPPRGLEVATSFVPPNLEQLDAITARPLFEPGRRPAAAPSAGAPSGLPTDGAGADGAPPRIAGVVTAPGRRRALLRPAGEAAPVWASVGDQVTGWTVRSILPEGVEVERDGRTRLIPLHED